MMKGGNTAPNIDNSTPGIPPNLNPTTIAPFIAIGPGADCAIAAKSNISSSSIQCNSSTNLLFNKVIMTYPPPKVKALKYNVEINSLK
ncbi:hypothetical protein SDC9_180989 [bioreactor metagenome]|uniref:Uncharacterized protein n=1 Tax=bioreactor metagenome TaxID=1076179 RepID=A0A645H383_9ZZZZ